MRITNKIMQKNNLSNINTNKIYQDKLTSQMSTQKKINRPSEDPVVAIRALRLRSNVTEITQYYSHNIPDAESWLDVTESALNNLSAVVTDMIAQCTKGSNGDLTTSDKQIILEQLKELGGEVYSTGNVDYAGRYVFTGYRTGTSLSFAQDENISYSITEQLDNGAIDKITMVNTDKLLELNANNYTTTTPDNLAGISEKDISSVEVYRIRLAYDDCSANEDGNATPSISFSKLMDDGSRTAVTWPGDGVTIQTVSSYDDPYTLAATDDNAVIYVPETGELLFGKNRYADLMAVKDDTSTVLNEGEIRFTYQKDEWVTGDLRPEHYFYCEATDDTGSTVVYNPDYLKPDTEKQVIEYDVGYNQTIRVNTTADESFQHGIGREVDDLVNALQNVIDLENLIADMEKWQETAAGGDAETIAQQLDAATKALTLAKDKSQKLFESGITTFQGYLDSVDLCLTNCGTRSSKLELINNRMQNQKTTFETLKSENEDADITEVAIQLNSAELTYEAALMAAGKVMKTTLLDFI